MIALVRVDNRLLHGQVVQAWLPFLSAGRILVIDDEAAESPLVRAAMELCVPPDVRVDVTAFEELSPEAIADAARGEERVLVLVREVEDAVRARARGLGLQTLNLGNIHFATGRRQVSPSVYLAPEEVQRLHALAEDGVAVEARALPKDPPVLLPEIEAKIPPAT